ncbi:MAG: hypothetical protein AAF725_08390 [Acidobacteriota bacterium]
MAESGEKLLTLTEVSNRTNISMPTLQRYKKQYQDQIPSEGTGRTQRYPEEALEIFVQLKNENMKKRGRPRKNKAVEEKPKAVRRAPAPKAAAPAKAQESGDGLLTLKEIGEATSISYPTLLRYVKANLARIPHTGEGRSRKYPPEAIDVFRTLRQESRRGRKAARTTTGPVRTTRVRPTAAAAAPSADVSDVQQQLKELQKAHLQLQRKVEQLEKEIAKPFKVVLKR